MNIKDFVNVLNSEFITGVPDSLLKPFCDYINSEYEGRHIVAANEGNAVGLAAGYYISTGKVPVVYMQNSGIGNVVNPVCSLLNEKVYGIPVIFVVGWRGEPGKKDEPQHIFQGEITRSLLEGLSLKCFVLDENTDYSELKEFIEENNLPASKQSIAVIVKKGALEYENKIKYQNEFCINREKAIEDIANAADNDFIISTTGKISRELFEFKEHNDMSHSNEFLNVGSMGHCSSIALSVAINNPDKRIWCLDGDGALLMHMGAMATIGSINPDNLIHIVLNNAAHDTVGGVHTCADNINICEIAKACGYKKVVSVSEYEEIAPVLEDCKSDKTLTLVEIKVKQGARADLMRPNIAPVDNMKEFMKLLKNKNGEE